MKPFIEMKDVSFEYESADKIIKAVDDVSFDIYAGEFVAVLGHNGCGKSTLAKHLNALFLPTSGKVFVDGLDTSDEKNKYAIRSKVGLILQNPDNQIVSSIVEDDVAFGPENLGVEPKLIRERVDNALKAVSMYEYRNHAADKLSGGQKQRVSIAGVLAMGPQCIVLDEPTAMLDPKGREEVISTIRRLNKEHKVTIILITHHMEEAVLADRVVVMENGRILMSGCPRDVFSNVNLLKENRLSVPQPTELIYRLRKKGYNLRKDVLNVDECVIEIERLLKGNL